MKKKSERIQLVIELSQRAESEAAQSLGHAQDSVSYEKQRLLDIKQYYSSYEQHFSIKTNGLRASEIANSRDFLSNLDNACHAQEAQVLKAERIAESARELWQKIHLKTQSIESYQERCHDQERQAEDKKEQSVVDEMSLRSHRASR